MGAEEQRNIAVVAIGRNEGARLQRCLQSLGGAKVVYVDSGSSDGSAAMAAAMGCAVAELDAAQPFSAARARNEGFACLMRQWADVEFVQFLDGDCELAEGWLEQGVAALRERADVGIMSGNVREAHPEESVYNRLCALEWQQAPGEIRSSGGRFMVRSEVFRAVGGFRADVIAAEDDEFCIRVRAAGWKIVQMDAEMARHDANMTNWSQWWRRSRRTGHAYAQVAALHGRGEERYFVRDCRRVWLWGFVLPVMALLLSPLTRGWSLAAMLGVYALQTARIYRQGRRRGWATGDAAVYAWFTVLFKFPALLGQIEYYWRQRRGDAARIIEYKRS